MNIFLLAITCVAFSVSAQFLLKTGMSGNEIRVVLNHALGIKTAIVIFSNLFILSGFLLYGLSAIGWLKVLSQWDVSKAYPIVGIGFIFTVIIGNFLGEEISFSRSFGVAMISIGVILVGRS